MESKNIDLFIEDFYEYILKSLDASHENCRRIQLFNMPSRRFIIGTLADKSKASGRDENSKTVVQNNSLSIRFLVKKEEKREIQIKPFCSVFFKVYPTYQEQKSFLKLLEKYPSMDVDIKNPKFAEIWQQHECTFESFQIILKDNSIKLDFSPIIGKIKNNYKLFSKNHGYSDSWMEDESIFNSKLSNHFNLLQIPEINWEAKINVVRNKFNNIFDIITISFENITEEKKGFETTLFRCNLKINLGDIEIEDFNYEFFHEDQKISIPSFLRCLNCQASYSNNEIITRSYGLYKQPKIYPRTEYENIDAKFVSLIGKNALYQLNKIYEKMNELLKDYEKSSKYNNSNPSYYKRTNHFREIIIRFKEGIDSLSQNKNALKAFCLMQKTFTYSSNYEGWRLFQIVFIVSMVPDIINIKHNREIVELIHVNTGGGKSETYFGVIIFQLFWDRITGKLEGVSGFVKFPLRMLSIQQLNRLARVIVCAEMIRKKEKIEGNPFSLGYFVGVSDDFPRHTYEAIRTINNIINEGKEPKGILLEKCPLCDGDVIRKIIKDKHTIHHVCNNCGEIFYLYFTNEEIYRFLPSFIVSTVDKFASIATNRRMKCLLGGKVSKCPDGHGYTPYMDKCDVIFSNSKSCGKIGNTKMEKFDGPSLMIQDEMHLLREGFGTIDSHFESLINTFNKKFSKKEFKYITLTATVSGVQDQIHNLYGKKVRIFPGESPIESKDFFFNLDYANGNEQIQRILIGLKPNLRDNQYASLITIYYIAQFLENMYCNLNSYSKRYGISKEKLKELLSYYQCLLTYHGKKADVHGIKYFLHTVVTSKLENFNIISRTLTGDNTLDEIKNNIFEIEKFSEKAMHATFATSVVSHGVDIDRWNIMIFQGMTRNTSEYIQSLSRVGRKLKGIVFLWYYPNRVRDLSFYQNFEIYHKMLHTRVEHTPLSRWVKLGFQQTFTSIFSAAIINYFSDYFEFPLYKVADVNECFKDIKNKSMLIDFLQEAFYTQLKETGSEWIKRQIPIETENRLNFLEKFTGSSSCMNFFPNALSDSGNYYYKTQFGMRGIQPEINLILSNRLQNFFDQYTKEGKS